LAPRSSSRQPIPIQVWQESLKLLIPRDWIVSGEALV
jgi:hypothetical protein